jgi:signal transduction histidine kinase
MFLGNLRKIKQHLLWKFIRHFSRGITTSEDYAIRDNIRLTNLVHSISIAGVLIMSVAFFAVSYYLQALAAFGSCLLLSVSFYLSTKGKSLAAKIFTTATINISLLIWCCVFSHNGYLYEFFLFMATICIYVYTRKERKWAVISVSFSLLFFVIETTSLKNYLPALNLVNTPAQMNTSNNILIASLLIVFVGELSSFVVLAEIREKKLSNTKQMLLASREKLTHQNDDLKAFGAAASHSLQTPIYVSRSFINKLKVQHQIHGNPVSTEYYDIVDSSLLQMENFISGLFLYYNIIDMQSHAEMVSLSDELYLLKKMLSQKYPDADFIMPGQSVSFAVNRMLLVIILQSVMENALKYNISDRPFVKIDLLQMEGRLSLLISDNGIGIKEAYVEKIFKPFVRVEYQGIEGSGLGLAGARRAAEAIGAELYCQQSGNEGSTFRLDIPVSMPENIPC